MAKKLIPTWAYDYRKLKELYPNLDEFYELYYDGDYYNQASSTYYDKDGNELLYETHGYYG